jgi:hypothetical protein
MSTPSPTKTTTMLKTTTTQTTTIMTFFVNNNNEFLLVIPLMIVFNEPTVILNYPTFGSRRFCHQLCLRIAHTGDVTTDAHGLRMQGGGYFKFLPKSLGGQSFPDKIARGVHYFGFYCIFIYKSFEICLYLPSPAPPCTSMNGYYPDPQLKQPRPLPKLSRPLREIKTRLFLS